MTLQFRKAIKSKAKGRIALIGVSGGGKSYTALTAARELVGAGKIAAVDTEHGSLSKYAHTPTCGGEGACDDPSHFEFDVIELDEYSPDTFKACMKAAREGGYDAIIFDSLSHFWMGKGGALEFVDLAAKKSNSRDSMSGWKEFRPHERAMVDEMIAAPFHVIVTMRSKTDYQEVDNGKGGKKRVKVGLAPVQREGMEFEFDLVGMMDDENNLIIDKSRCFAMNGKVYPKPDAKVFSTFAAWLGTGADRIESRPAAMPGQSSRSEAPGPYSRHKVQGSTLIWTVADVHVKHTAKRKPYLNLIFAGGAPFQDKGVVCWHASLFELLQTAKGKVCQLEFETGGNFVTISNVIAIGDQEYRDGKPFDPSAEIPDMDPPNVGPIVDPQQGTLITDADLPASMFADEPAGAGAQS